MGDQILKGRRVLVVEDEYLLADELQIELEEAGATIVGLAGTLADATALIEAHQNIDGAILDVNLSGEMVYPAADLLIQRGTPFVFLTGYDQAGIPFAYQHIRRFEKPTDVGSVARALFA